MTANKEVAVRTLFRPGGPQELALIEVSGFSEFPPRLEGQPTFIRYKTESTPR
jgi:hypothetical protein